MVVQVAVVVRSTAPAEAAPAIAGRSGAGRGRGGAGRGKRNTMSDSEACDEEEKSSSSESEDEKYTYITVRPSKCPAVSNYFSYVQRRFEDIDEGGVYEVVGVVEMRSRNKRQSSNKVYAFKYIYVDDPKSTPEYTPVIEILNSYWCKWSAAPSSTGRAARASRRHMGSEAPTPNEDAETTSAPSEDAGKVASTLKRKRR